MFDNRVSIPAVRQIGRMALGCVIAVLILGMYGPPASAVSSPSPSFTFVIDPSWSPTDQAQLQSWLSPDGPVMKTVFQVAGPPAQNTTITVAKETTGAAGDYDPADHRINLSSLQLSVLVHELNHATRDSRILDDRVWEEGLARAAETEDMRLLAQQGITESGYDYSHGYGYDEYYENNNVLTVGVPNGNIYIEPALTLLRYEQAGYAFTMVMMENPKFVRELNAKLFTHPNGSISPNELVGMAAEVQPRVEGLPFAEWEQQQLIFDTNQQPGCYLFERSNQFTVDFFCTNQYGEVTVQMGAEIKLKILGPFNEEVFNASGTTSDYGWVSFEPALRASIGRIKLVATAESPSGPVSSTFYRQSGGEEGVFGVVTNADTGSVSFSSPSGQFTPFSVPVTKGAFVAPSLSSVRGQVVALFSGQGMSASRTFNKDASPYSLVVTARLTPPPPPEERPLPTPAPIEKESPGRPAEGGAPSVVPSVTPSPSTPPAVTPLVTRPKAMPKPTCKKGYHKAGKKCLKFKPHKKPKPQRHP